MSDAELRGAVLEKAVLRACEKLQLPPGALVNVLQIPDPIMLSPADGSSSPDLGNDASRRARKVLQLYRALTAVFAGDDLQAAIWLRGRNSVLDAVPVELIQAPGGLAKVLEYLESRCQFK
jgi:hypothetical protein